MSEQLESERQEVPDYRLDTESVAHILFHGRDLFDDESWFERFNWQRYQLVHINAKVDYLNDAINFSILHPGSIFAKDGVARQRYVSLLVHAKKIEQEISDLLTAYEKVA